MTYKIRDQRGKDLPFVFNDIMGLECASGGVMTPDVVTALKGHVKDGYTVR